MVIQELGLAKVADSKIGTQFFPDVSGEESKRTGIGMELITDPSILFLDKPTTGLYPSSANAVFLLLKRCLNRDEPSSSPFINLIIPFSSCPIASADWPPED